jgi:hypothetical protein
VAGDLPGGSKRRVHMCRSVFNSIVIWCAFCRRVLYPSVERGNARAVSKTLVWVD